MYQTNSITLRANFCDKFSIGCTSTYICPSDLANLKLQSLLFNDLLKAEESAGSSKLENILVGDNNLSQWASVAKGAKSNFNQEMPKDNFILHTKTTAKPPFTIKFEIEKGGISEVYASKVLSTNRQAYVLSLPKGILMKSGIINF